MNDSESPPASSADEAKSFLPEHWQELARLVDTVLDAPEEQRAQVLDEVTGGDPQRHAELERLVAECERDVPLFNRPAAERFSRLIDEEAEIPLPEMLGGRYRIEREVGHGGMARVYLARDAKHARNVAVKVIRPDVAASLGRDRFLREIGIAARLRHPNIVPLYDSGDADGVLYFVMPYEEGPSLGARLRDGPLPVSEGLSVLRDVARALAYAHEQGVVHRDVKPDNVMLSGGAAVVTDFGIAKAIAVAAGRPPVRDGADLPATAITQLGVGLGTPAYMAPEQALGDPDTNHRADIYAFGCLAYELFAGKPPFHGLPTHQIIAAHVGTVPVPLSEVSATVPDSVARLVARCLEKDPAARPQSAQELLAPLEGTQTGPNESVRLPRRASASVLAVAAGIAVLLGGYVLFARSKPPAVRTTPSIAVMAFSNIGGDATNEAFSDGMSEELITNLGKVGGLSVVARSSAFSFKGKPLSAPELGSKLRVRYLVEGSVRWAGDRLRVNAQLIDAATGKLLWSDEYDRHPRDVFAVQDEITKAIVGQLRLKLSPAASASIAKHPTESTEAHNLYLLGRFFFAKRDSASLRKAQDYFERAIRVDSSYALAYAGLSDAYSHRSVFGYAAPRDVLPQARTAALKALSLDSTLVEARTSLGFILLFFEWNWAAAGRELDTALAIDPNYSPAHLYHAWYFVASGKPRDAVNEGREAVRLEPLYLINNTRLADFLYFARRYDEAVVQAKSVLELEPAFFQGRAALARAYSQLGRCDQAVRALDERPEETPWFRGIAGQVYARCGRRAQALSELERLRAEARQGLSFSHHAVAVIDAALGEKDEAFAQLDSAYAAHDWHMFTIMGDAAWDQLRADPRFAQLTRKIGLTP